MAEAAKTEKKKTTPKGGRRGGTLFPKINLQKALEYSKKLVAKTHVSAQPADEILPGVFGTSGPDGQVRASALKQFGLMQGDAKAYEATQLAISTKRLMTSVRRCLDRPCFHPRRSIRYSIPIMATQFLRHRLRSARKSWEFILILPTNVRSFSLTRPSPLDSGRQVGRMCS